MGRDHGALAIILPVSVGPYRLLVDLVWFGVWLAVEGALLASLAGARILPGGGRLLLIPFLLFTVAGFFLAYRLLWYWGGRERFVAGPDGLRVAREIFGLGRERAFPPEQVRGLRVRRLHLRLAYPLWGRMFVGNGNGELLIDTGGAEVAYGKGLAVEEAERLADLLRSELPGSRAAVRRPTEFRLR
jgi:hypothetical protein